MFRVGTGFMQQTLCNTQMLRFCWIYMLNFMPIVYYRVIALISVNTVPSWDIKGRELASVRRYPKQGTIFTDISVITLLLYSYKYFVPFAVVCDHQKWLFYSVRVRFCTSVWPFFARHHGRSTSSKATSCNGDMRRHQSKRADIK